SAGYNESTGIATVELKRVKDSEGQSDVVFGAYEEENGRKSLSSVQIEDEINPQIGQTATVEKTITGDVIDAFIWKSKESMIPLAKAINLKSNEQNNDFSEYVDFVVDVEEGREPVILQITDTQIIDSSQRRTKSRISDTAIAYWKPDKMDELCFDYLREVVAETKPDFIIMTGDNVYGEFDDDGSCFKALVDVMESFNIPWAPIYGNHDAETALGVDWQCARLENAPNCLFKQRTLTGNGNYSVGITQGGELKRVFFMLDSNGAANISEKSLANGHSTATRGFGQDQIAWYTAAAQKINNAYPGMKYSFAYHIPLTIAQEAIGRYQKVTEDNDSELIENLGKLDDGDFGYICGGFNSKWDKDKIIYEGMKALGCDSHFFGHEHTYSASVVYDGTRFQFGQKSSDYDEINHMLADGTVKKGAATSNGTPMVGGTVMKMAQDGSFSDLHIHYCDGIIE
ncbi:MAG: metallophosphoesterase, partial [Firmicutes bacterium]|nr:metallophosphoesterase [Bacillota bacterium]